MKKLNILLLSAIAMGFTFTSCTNDDSDKTPSNVSLTGKWEFSKFTMKNSDQETQTMDAPFGFLSQSTQCDAAPDYLNFTSDTTVEYGDNDTQNTADCTLSKFNITYLTSGSTITLKSNNSQGSDLVLTVVKKTSTELQLKMDSQGYIFTLVKAAN